MAFPGTGTIWMNGKLVEWKDATIHIASHIVHYGSGVFEGARCYDTVSGPACFRLDAHMRRLLDSARIDGASEIRIFVRLILPLGLPAIASLAIFQVLFVWNDLLIGLVLAQSNQPISPHIASQLRQFGSNLDVLAPAAFFSAVIPLTIFALFQRYFVQGLLAGSVK